ncbi:hypothetical protein ACFL1E_00910 [Candidatus Omnitrophota bacterium]
MKNRLFLSIMIILLMPGFALSDVIVEIPIQSENKEEIGFDFHISSYTYESTVGLTISFQPTEKLKTLSEIRVEARRFNQLLFNIPLKIEKEEDGSLVGEFSVRRNLLEETKIILICGDPLYQYSISLKSQVTPAFSEVKERLE